MRPRPSSQTRRAWVAAGAGGQQAAQEIPAPGSKEDRLRDICSPTNYEAEAIAERGGRRHDIY